MIDALTYQIMLEEISENARRYDILDDTIGILIMRPDLPTGKNILDSLEYFHFRTDKSVNFYLPGYGANWPFSNKMFAQLITELEKYSKCIIPEKVNYCWLNLRMEFYLMKVCAVSFR